MAMKNKMAFWRKMAKKQPDGTRTGRMIRNMMAGSNHPGMISPIHVWLFKRAGIAMPVYDEQQKKRQEAMAQYAEQTKIRLAPLAEAVATQVAEVQDVEFTEVTV